MDVVEEDGEKKKVLFVGLACFDIVMVCEEYPQEDSDQRALCQRLQRGGNATNSCTVFNSFQICPTEYLGTMTDDYGGRLMQDDLKKQGVLTSQCVIKPELSSPTSVVLSSVKTGSRTIVHFNNDLPELAVTHFQQLRLGDYRWIHFEGRNIENVSQMMTIVKQWNARTKRDKITVSVELEKNNPQLMILIEDADVVFIGKQFGTMIQCTNSNDVIKQLSNKVKPGAILISAWGEYGAACMDEERKIHASPSFPPAKIVDTLGAGDTFLAACIAALMQGKPASEVITIGCRVAGAKCGIEGYNPSVLKRVYDCACIISSQ